MEKYCNLAILFFKIFLKSYNKISLSLYFKISVLILQVFMKNSDDFLAIKRYLKIRTSMYFWNFFEVQVHTSTCTYKSTSTKVGMSFGNVWSAIKEQN